MGFSGSLAADIEVLCSWPACLSVAALEHRRETDKEEGCYEDDRHAGDVNPDVHLAQCQHRSSSQAEFGFTGS